MFYFFIAWGPHVSATGLPSQHVDPVNRSTGGPGPTSQWPETVPRGCQLGTRRRRAGANSGDQNNGGPSPELAGTVLRGSVSGVRGCVPTSIKRRIDWWPRPQQGRPEKMSATRWSGRPLWVSSGSSTQGTGRLVGVLVGLLGAPGTRPWACASVTAGVATAARRSAATGSRQRRQGSYGAREVNEEEQGMNKLTTWLTRWPVTV